MASYFSYFPNVYVGEGITADEGFKYRLVKNIFRRLKVRDDLQKYTSFFEAYSIRDGESPSDLAYRLYRDAHLDWAILLVNNITDFYEQWPKEQQDLEDYVNRIYEDPDSVHHYETNEILFNDIVYIKEGETVTEDFVAVMPDGTTKTLDESRYPVSNYEHEYYLNEQKRLISLPNAYIIDMMQSEMTQLLSYNPHPELDDSGNKKTELSVSSRFVNNAAGAIIGSASRTAGVQTVTSFDYGPTTGASVGVATSTTTTSTSTTTTTTSTSSSSSGSSGSSGGSGY